MVETGGIAAGLGSGVSRCSALQSSLDKVEQGGLGGRRLHLLFLSRLEV